MSVTQCKIVKGVCEALKNLEVKCVGDGQESQYQYGISWVGKCGRSWHKPENTDIIFKNEQGGGGTGIPDHT